MATQDQYKRLQKYLLYAAGKITYTAVKLTDDSKNTGVGGVRTFLSGRNKGTYDFIDLDQYYTKDEVDELILNEADARLKADDELQEEINLEITDRETADEELQDALNQETSDRKDADDELRAALDQEITDRLNADQKLYEYLQSEITNILEVMQTKLTAGFGISIEDDVISCTLDTDVFVIVDSLPTEGIENKIYLVPSDILGDENIFIEYIYANELWEKLGEFKPDVDLSEYTKTADLDALLTGWGFIKSSDLPEYDAGVTTIRVTNGSSLDMIDCLTVTPTIATSGDVVMDVGLNSYAFQNWIENLYHPVLWEATDLTSEPTVNDITSTSERYYGIEVTPSNKLVVNVPWTSGSGGTSLTTVVNQATAPLTLGGSILGSNLLLTGSVATATDTSLGVVMPYTVARSEMAVNSVTTTSGRTYGVIMQPSGLLVVNVPWVSGESGGSGIDTVIGDATSPLTLGGSYADGVLTLTGSVNLSNYQALLHHYEESYTSSADVSDYSRLYTHHNSIYAVFESLGSSSMVGSENVYWTTEYLGTAGSIAEIYCQDRNKTAYPRSVITLYPDFIQFVVDELRGSSYQNEMVFDRNALYVGGKKVLVEGDSGTTTAGVSSLTITNSDTSGILSLSGNRTTGDVTVTSNIDTDKLKNTVLPAVDTSGDGSSNLPNVYFYNNLLVTGTVSSNLQLNFHTTGGVAGVEVQIILRATTAVTISFTGNSAVVTDGHSSISVASGNYIEINAIYDGSTIYVRSGYNAS